jgi:hypothetical protein
VTESLPALALRPARPGKRPKMASVGRMSHRPPRRYRIALVVLVAAVVTATNVAGSFAADLTKHFRSEVQQVRPAVPGLTARVLNRDEQLELRNGTGRTVVVEGYDREPYLRFKPNGVVEQNQRSPATYLNRDRLGLQKIPAAAVPNAKPVWKAVSSGGEYRWFDHRIHIPSPNRPPPQAKGKDDPVKVFDWKVPLAAGQTKAQLQGTLLWVPKLSSGGSSTWIVAPIAGGVVALLVAGALMLRRRRRGQLPTSAHEEPAREAW